VGWAGGDGGAAGTGSSGAPQRAQKRAAGALALPHVEQVISSSNGSKPKLRTDE